MTKEEAIAILEAGSGLSYDQKKAGEFCEAYDMAVEALKAQASRSEIPNTSPVWHECLDDDPNTFPDDDRNVLVSFSNFSLSIIGQWRVDEYGSGCWYLGDTDETFLEEGLFVDGWWELPKKPERKYGEWIPQDYNMRNGCTSTAVYYYPKCSVCGQSGDYIMRYCPNCGADMRGGRMDPIERQ